MKAVINNNKIKNVFMGNIECIPINPTDIIIEVPYGFTCKEGDDIRCWNHTTWELNNAEDNISNGYVVLKNTEKIVNHKIVDKTLQELYDEGIYIPKPGWIVYNNIEYDTTNLPLYKYEQTVAINNAFNNNLSNGRFTFISSTPMQINTPTGIKTSTGVVIDCRRSGTKNDLQNVQGLILLNQTITYVGYYYTFIVTPAQLNEMQIQMINYGNSLYQKKWEKESEINSAITIQQLEDITW